MNQTLMLTEQAVRYFFSKSRGMPKTNTLATVISITKIDVGTHQDIDYLFSYSVNFVENIVDLVVLLMIQTIRNPVIQLGIYGIRFRDIIHDGQTLNDVKNIGFQHSFLPRKFTADDMDWLPNTTLLIVLSSIFFLLSAYFFPKTI